MKRTAVIFASALLLVVIGCGLGTIRTEHTINAYIVVEIRQQIEKQADDLLNFIEGPSEAAPSQTEANPPKKTSWLDKALGALTPIQPVYAAELEITDSPRVQELAKSLKERHPKIQALKDKGCAGEDNRGYVDLRNPDVFTDSEEKNAAQKLIAEEKADRKELYQEIAQLNKEHDLTVAFVERTYARKRLDRAKPGEIFQLPENEEDFKAFKESETGKKLGDECKPGAWVTIK